MMTKEELRERRQTLYVEYENKKKALLIEYAQSNNPYKVGDIIQDHIGKARIEGIDGIYPLIDGTACMVYKCVNLTVKGEINKREPKRKVYQTNIKNE